MNDAYGEYLEKGDYHKQIDKNWSFYPVYMEKIRLIEKFLDANGHNKKILDLGCGEGVLVDKYKRRNYDIIGVDYNYESENVLKRSVVDTRFPNNNFDIILNLDVLEHISFAQQEEAFDEISRILKPGGMLVLTLPNMAHLASRFFFFFFGRPIRTSEIKRHQGERAIAEYIKLIKEKKFSIIKRKGLFPTYPIISAMTYFLPSKMVFWHRMASKFFGYPNWSAINFLVCMNNKDRI